MDFELNETERLLHDSLLRFVQAEAPRDAAQDWGHAVAMGWHAAATPEAQGGFGMGLVGAMLIAESLGAALSALSWRDAAVVPALALAALADEGDADCADWLEGFLAGDLAVHSAYLDAPPAAGELVLEVVPEGPEIGLVLLRYRKGGQGHVALAGAPALRRDGPSRGNLRVDPTGLRCLALPAALEGRLDTAARITAAADHLGAMQALMDMTLDYVRTRQQFGRPLGAFQALQHRLVDMFVALEEARALSMAAAMAATAARADAARLAAAAWDCARRAGAKIAEEAIQMHGGIGMTEECRVGAYVKRILRNEASVA